MTSIFEVPYTDIVTFLTTYGIVLDKNEENNYLEAKVLIENPSITEIPTSIADLIIASNLINQNLRRYRTTEILLSPYNDPELIELTNLFGFEGVNKERLIRILGYLHKLDNDMNIYNTLPKEVLRLIALKLDCRDITLLCKLSVEFEKFCKIELRSILYEKLAPTTLLNITGYTEGQLQKFCILKKRHHLATNEELILMTSNDGNVHSYGSGKLRKDRGYFQFNPTNKISNVHQVSIGDSHILILKENGTVYSLGDNLYGQLGIGNHNEKDEETLIPKINNIVKVAAGYNQSLLLNDRGEVYSFGNNQYGELGLGKYGIKSVPVLIPNIDNIIDISSATGCSLLLNNKGQVYSFGFTENGSLGLGDEDPRIIPTIIPDIDNIISVSCGGYHSLLLNDSGQVYGFGSNQQGQLGFKGNFQSLSLNNEGQIYGFENNGQVQIVSNEDDIFGIYLSPEIIPDLDNIVSISAGIFHSLALNRDGIIYGFGDNEKGQLGLIEKFVLTPKPILYGIIELTAGLFNSLLMDNEGNVHHLGTTRINNELEDYSNDLESSVNIFSLS